MSYSKIDLENRIFARADRLGEAVWGWEGELVYAGKDLCLQLLMCVYNGFFAAENRAFLADTDECCGEFWADFKAQQLYPPPPLLRRFSVPFFAADFEAELFLSR